MKTPEKFALLVCISTAAVPGVEATFDDVEKLSRLIAVAPSSDLYFSRASALSKRGKHAEAVVDLDYALLLKPDDRRYLITKAFELNRLSRFEESNRICLRAASKKCENPRANWTEIVLQACNRRRVRLSQ